MGKGDDMANHVNDIKTISEHLEAIGDSIAEHDLVIILISSLPEEFNYNYIRDNSRKYAYLGLRQ